MIIIKTKNGDRFVNDKAFDMVEHDREKAVVNCYGGKGEHRIENVEAVLYTSDAQPVHWQDEGSAMKRMQESLNERDEVLSKQRNELLAIEQERDELKARLAELEPTPTPARWWPADVDRQPISAILSHFSKGGWDPGYEVRLGRLFEQNDIKTVGDLLRIGRRNFKKYRSVGGGSISRIDDALEELYGIKGW